MMAENGNKTELFDASLDDQAQENVKKRRRNSSISGAGNVIENNAGALEKAEEKDETAQIKGDIGEHARQNESNLTIKNVADHVKRCEEEEREKKVGKVNLDKVAGQNTRESVDCAANVGAISLDEVVDNFSTMATDGSRHSMCGSCDGEAKEDKGAVASARVSCDSVPTSDHQRTATTPIAGDDTREYSDGTNETGDEDVGNKFLDADGNITNPDEIGEPNEPLLGRWQAERIKRRDNAMRTKFDEFTRDGRVSDCGSPNASHDSSVMVASPSGGALFYEAAATPDHVDDSLDTTSYENVPPISSSIGEDEDSILTLKSDDAAEASSQKCSWSMPPHKWNAFKAVRGREFGLRSVQSPDWFRFSANGSLHFVQRLELMYKMEFHDGCVNCLHFNESGTRLASGSDDLDVIIWDWAADRAMITFASGHAANIFQAKFMPLSGDCHVVTCARDGQVRLAELSVRGVCKSTRKLAQHRGAAHKLTLELESPHTFLSCGEDAVVYQLDLRDPKPKKLLVCKDSSTRSRDAAKVPLYSIHSHPRNPYYFAVSGRDQYCRLYDKRMIVDATEPLKKFCPQHLIDHDYHKVNVTAVVFNYDGTELLGSYNDDDIYLFNTEQTNETEYKHRYRGHRNNATVKGVNFYGPRSEFIVSGSDCGYIYFWEKESEKIVQFLPGDEGGVVNVLEPHPTCAILATSGLDHDVKIWVPSCEEPKLDFKALEKAMRQNARERDRERREQPELIDHQMLWYIMSRMRRAARRAERGEGSDESGGDDSETDNTDGDEDGGDGPVALQCRPS